MFKLFFTIGLVFGGMKPLHGQVAVTKLIGKHAKAYKLGYGIFSSLNFPLNAKNKSIRLELLDVGLYPGQDPYYALGYVSIKCGYKYIFSEDQTGLFIEPSAGYSTVLSAVPYLEEAIHSDGIAAAFEFGYNMEIGKRGHTISLGVKYEYDRGSADYILNFNGTTTFLQF